MRPVCKGRRPGGWLCYAPTQQSPAMARAAPDWTPGAQCAGWQGGKVSAGLGVTPTRTSRAQMMQGVTE